jgi:hypothetical protein
MEMYAKQERKNCPQTLCYLGTQKRNGNFPFGSCIIFKEKNCKLLNNDFLNQVFGSTFPPILSHSSKNQTRSY